MLRVLRGSSSRPHTAPQQYSVTSSWNGLLNSSAFFSGIGDIGLAQHRLANFQSLVVCLLVHDVSLGFCLMVPAVRGGRYGVAAAQSRLRVMRISGCGLPAGTGASLPPLCYDSALGNPESLLSGATPDPSEAARDPDATSRLQLGAGPAAGEIRDRVGADLAASGAAAEPSSGCFWWCPGPDCG